MDSFLPPRTSFLVLKNLLRHVVAWSVEALRYKSVTGSIVDGVIGIFH